MQLLFVVNFYFFHYVTWLYFKHSIHTFCYTAEYSVHAIEVRLWFMYHKKLA